MSITENTLAFVVVTAPNMYQITKTKRTIFILLNEGGCMNEDREGIPFIAGTIGGLLAWIVGYAITYMGTVDRLEGHHAAQLLDGVTNDAEGWKLVGWLFYNAHTVDIALPQIGILSPQEYNAIGASDGPLWLLYLLPPVLLALAGVGVVLLSLTPIRSVRGGAVAGATIALGYCLATAAGLVVFTVGIDESVIRPDPVSSLLLAGLFYPLAFGALGGALAGATNRAVFGTVSVLTS